MAPHRGIQSTESSPKKRIASNGNRLPDHIREGEVLTDLTNQKWKLGRSVGLGGFGEIYLASPYSSKPVDEDAKYVIKVESHESGPLFVEMHFYMRGSKLEMLDSWVAQKDMEVLGMPYYVGAGSHVHKGKRFRFLVLPRFGTDVEKIFLIRKRCFADKTAFTLATYIIDILEYIHHHGYVHNDIKNSNLLLGLKNQAPLFLVDFGLSAKYVDLTGNHKPYATDERKAHSGTLEFTSRDAHVGVYSRRSDLEVLGYVITQWLCGELPWENDLSDPENIASIKNEAMTNIPYFLTKCFKGANYPSVLEEFLIYVSNLGFEEKPNYKYCKRLFIKGVQNSGYLFDGKFSFDLKGHLVKNEKKNLSKSEAENRPCHNNKRKRSLQVHDLPNNRKPCALKNSNRLTRKALHALSAQRTRNNQLLIRKEYDWTKIIAGNPEKVPMQNPAKRPRLSPPPLDTDQKSVCNSRPPSPATIIKRCLNCDTNPTPAMREQIQRLKQKARELSSSAPATLSRRTSHVSNSSNELSTLPYVSTSRCNSRCSSPEPATVTHHVKRKPTVENAKTKSATQVTLRVKSKIVASKKNVKAVKALVKKKQSKKSKASHDLINDNRRLIVRTNLRPIKHAKRSQTTTRATLQG